MKKTAVLLYPLFSLQEIGTLTELLKFYDREIVTFSAGREPVKSEDGFTILPDRELTEFCREEFDSLVLPGIWEPLPVLLDNRIIRFLEQFRGDDGLLIAAISAGPLLLGRAGLLEGRRFTHGVFEEFLDAFPVMPRENAVRTYLVEGIDCPAQIFSPMEGKDYAEEDFIFHLPPEILPEARAFWDKCLAEQAGQDQ